MFNAVTYCERLEYDSCQNEIKKEQLL